MTQPGRRDGLDRRQFLRRVLGTAVGALGAAGAAAGAAGSARGQDAPAPGDARADRKLPPSSLPTRRLGRTGVKLPVLALGGFHVGDVARKQGDDAAIALVHAALDEGIRFIDTAEQYQKGGSETLLGKALKDLRDEVFLMTKTHVPESRSYASAEKHLAESLERLQTNRLDLWQLHSVKSPEDVDRSFDEGGAMEFIREAKRDGRVRFIGVTGHVNPAANLRALHWFDQGVEFDTMQFPLNPIDAHQVSFRDELLPELVKRDIGVIAMKTSGGGALLEQGISSIEENLRYALTWPISAAVVGMESVEQVKANAALVRAMQPMDEAELEALAERLGPQARLDLEWYKQRI